MKKRSKTISFSTYNKIERALNTDKSYSQIAEEFSVSKSTVCRIYQKAYQVFLEQGEQGKQYDN